MRLLKGVVCSSNYFVSILVIINLIYTVFAVSLCISLNWGHLIIAQPIFNYCVDVYLYGFFKVGIKTCEIV